MKKRKLLLISTAAFMSLALLLAGCNDKNMVENEIKNVSSKIIDETSDVKATESVVSINIEEVLEETHDSFVSSSVGTVASVTESYTNDLIENQTPTDSSAASNVTLEMLYVQDRINTITEFEAVISGMAVPSETVLKSELKAEINNNYNFFNNKAYYRIVNSDMSGDLCAKFNEYEYIYYTVVNNQSVYIEIPYDRNASEKAVEYFEFLIKQDKEHGRELVFEMMRNGKTYLVYEFVNGVGYGVYWYQDGLFFHAVVDGTPFQPEYLDMFVVEKVTVGGSGGNVSTVSNVVAQ